MLCLFTEYNAEASSNYKLSLSYSNLTRSGPDGRTQQANIDDESDVDEKDESEPMEDNYVLLVKAWEQKVFPVIRRRFRNEAERKDGLEQIKGALQLGQSSLSLSDPLVTDSLSHLEWTILFLSPLTEINLFRQLNKSSVTG